jgi:hypothetical protein
MGMLLLIDTVSVWIVLSHSTIHRQVHNIWDIHGLRLFLHSPRRTTKAAPLVIHWRLLSRAWIVSLHLQRVRQRQKDIWQLYANYQKRQLPKIYPKFTSDMRLGSMSAAVILLWQLPLISVLKLLSHPRTGIWGDHTGSNICRGPALYGRDVASSSLGNSIRDFSHWDVTRSG